MYYYGNGYGLYILFHIIWIVIVIVFIVWIIRLIAGRGPHRFDERFRGRGGKTALDILKERYAKGEISKEEFEERKRILEQ